jgi:hypothetical protein
MRRDFWGLRDDGSVDVPNLPAALVQRFPYAAQ